MFVSLFIFTVVYSFSLLEQYYTSVPPFLCHCQWTFSLFQACGSQNMIMNSLLSIFWCMCMRFFQVYIASSGTVGLLGPCTFNFRTIPGWVPVWLHQGTAFQHRSIFPASHPCPCLALPGFFSFISISS